MMEEGNYEEEGSRIFKRHPWKEQVSEQGGMDGKGSLRCMGYMYLKLCGCESVRVLVYLLDFPFRKCNNNANGCVCRPCLKK